VIPLWFMCKYGKKRWGATRLDLSMQIIFLRKNVILRFIRELESGRTVNSQ